MYKIIFFLLFFSQSIFAESSLEQMVDELTPDQAYRILTKLEAKQYKPIPENFFLKMSVILGSGIQTDQQDDFNNSISSEFEDPDFSERTSIDVLWKVLPNFSFGFGTGRIKTGDIKEVSNDVFQAISLDGSYLHLLSSYKYNFNRRLGIISKIGLGILFAESSLLQTDENSLTSYINHYSGKGFSGNASFGLLFHLNPIFSIGTDLGYHFSEIDKLKKFGVKEITNPDTLDFGGGYLLLNIGINM